MIMETTLHIDDKHNICMVNEGSVESDHIVLGLDKIR